LANPRAHNDHYAKPLWARGEFGAPLLGRYGSLVATLNSGAFLAALARTSHTCPRSSTRKQRIDASSPRSTASRRLSRWAQSRKISRIDCPSARSGAAVRPSRNRGRK